MNKALFIIIPLLICIILMPSCNELSSDESNVSEVVDSFATKYFTWHFPDAVPYVDEDGEQWLKFMSSSVHGADIDLLKSTTVCPDYSIDEIKINEDTATVILDLTNVILMDTLGKVAHLQESATRTLTLIKYDDKWKIHSIQSNR